MFRIVLKAEYLSYNQINMIYMYISPSSELINQLGDMEKDYQDLLANKKQVEDKLQSLEEEKYDMDNEVEKHKSVLNEKDREMEVLQKDYEYAKERETVLMGDR